MPSSASSMGWLMKSRQNKWTRAAKFTIKWMIRIPVVILASPAIVLLAAIRVVDWAFED